MCCPVWGSADYYARQDKTTQVILLVDWSLNDNPSPCLLCLKETTLLIHQTCAKSSQQRTWHCLSHHSVILAEDAGDLESSVHASVMPHSHIHWMTWTLSMPSYGRESKRQLAQTPPFSWGPPYTHIYLLAKFLPRSRSYPLRFHHIGMRSPICPVLLKQWCIVPGWQPLNPCTLRSWMPCTLPTKVSPVWKLTPTPVCIGPGCRPVSSSATNSDHCVILLLSSSQLPWHPPTPHPPPPPPLQTPEYL